MIDIKRITRKEFDKLHKVCPVCGNDKIGTTLAGAIEYSDRDFVDDVNKVWCGKEYDGCGWKGKPIDLKPNENK